MAHDLEASNGDSTDWDVLYLARGAGEVVAHRPFFTGDVFTGVTVQPPRAEPKTKTVMIIQHPCAMRPTGVELDTSILVAEVRRFAVLPPERWNTNGKLMPLPDVLPEVTSGRRHQAALFDNTFHVHPDDLTDRIVCLSLRGVNLLLQRWVYHSSRVVVPSFDLNTAVSPVYEEADLVEEWCESATETGRSVAEATRRRRLAARGTEQRRIPAQDPGEPPRPEHDPPQRSHRSSNLATTASQRARHHFPDGYRSLSLKRPLPVRQRRRGPG